MSFNMTFEDPPNKSGRNPQASKEAAEAVAALTARPGEWACVWTGLTGTTANGRVTGMKRRGLDVTTRKADDGTFSVYARCPAVDR